MMQKILDGLKGKMVDVQIFDETGVPVTYLVDFDYKFTNDELIIMTGDVRGNIRLFKDGMVFYEPYRGDGIHIHADKADIIIVKSIYANNSMVTKNINDIINAFNGKQIYMQVRNTLFSQTTLFDNIETGVLHIECDTPLDPNYQTVYIELSNGTSYTFNVVDVTECCIYGYNDTVGYIKVNAHDHSQWHRPYSVYLLFKKVKFFTNNS